MNNISDYKGEKRVRYILPRAIVGKESISVQKQKKALVVFHLYYESSFVYYSGYISRIPRNIDLLFTVSSRRMKEKIEMFMSERENVYQIVWKENRGRDISALLVAARNEIKKYDYFCFIHDKSWKEPRLEKDTRNWIQLMCDSMLQSPTYINEIQHLFETEEQIGLLVPPPPVGEHMNASWQSNYDNTVRLAKELKLACQIDKDHLPIAFGTVFWARTKALEKLLSRNWCYEDFDPEPLAEDGTISHAIERILGYVSSDAGYLTAEVLPEQLAAERMIYVEESFGAAMKMLRENLGIRSMYALRTWETTKKKMEDFAGRYSEVYVFGAGIRGKDCLVTADYLKISVKGVLVTHKNEHEEFFHGHKIYEISNVQLNEGCGVIVAVASHSVQEVINHIKETYPGFAHIEVWE